MKIFRSMLAVASLLAALGACASAAEYHTGPAATSDGSSDAADPGSLAAAVTDGRDDFDFLFGEWRVHHRRTRPGTNEWVEFDGTCSTGPLMEGRANLEEHWMDSPAGAYRALGLRAYDPKAAQWSIWWLDGRYPSGPVGPPVKGRFAQGVGTFTSDYEQDGKPMRVRFLWSRITPTSARWEQAVSADAGETWQTNWIMEFSRVAAAQDGAAPARSTPQGQLAPQAQPVLARSDVSNFDFLTGDWRVRHRYLRAATNQWAEVEGTCTNRPRMEHAANIEEHWLNAPAGAYRALALRSYDAKTGKWAIWWLDGRDPGADLDPPLAGTFQDGVGTFVGETTLNGKLTPTRFIWSHIEPASARWQQSYSYDGGKTWEPVWTMEFQRQ